jgi:hypothetical protein
MDKYAGIDFEVLVATYGGVVNAAKATGIPRTTIQSRLEAAEVAANRSAEPHTSTIVPLAEPEPPQIADIPDTLSDLKHMVIPDTQCRPGVPLDHLRWAGLYACVKKPTTIINLGDHWDMASLCSYDKGKRAAENMRYSIDIEAGNKGMDLFMEPIAEEMERDPLWCPRLVLTRGNHEQRIERATQDNPELEGTLSFDALRTWGSTWDWEVYPFLKVVTIDGVNYAHYFTSGVMGRAVTTARALLTKKHESCVMGHVQSYQTAMDYTATGKRITALFAGCYYQHQDDYRDAQSNVGTWRGVHILYGVQNGEFTHNSIDIGYLKHRFSGK